jgi:hypothetical protein
VLHHRQSECPVTRVTSTNAKAVTRKTDGPSRRVYLRCARLLVIIQRDGTVGQRRGTTESRGAVRRCVQRECGSGSSARSVRGGQHPSSHSLPASGECAFRGLVSAGGGIAGGTVAPACGPSGAGQSCWEGRGRRGALGLTGPIPFGQFRVHSPAPESGPRALAQPSREHAASREPHRESRVHSMQCAESTTSDKLLPRLVFQARLLQGGFRKTASQAVLRKSAAARLLLRVSLCESRHDAAR